MPSRRFIDRGFWKSRELNANGARARLLAVYLFSEEADDFGRVKDDPYRLRHGGFPDDDVSDAEIVGMVDVLEKGGFVARYFARDGRPLLWIRRFHDYQPMKYHAVSRLDRHPEDTFEVIDKKKGVETPRPLAPVGYVAEDSGKFPQVAETSGKFPQSAETPHPNTNTHTNTQPAPDAAPSRARGGPVAAETTSSEKSADDKANGGFEGADDPAEAASAMAIFKGKTSLWNGAGTGERRRATAQARGMVGTYEGRVSLLAAVAESQGWRGLAKRLGKRGPAPPGGHEARAEAKGLLEG
jgi:hypothetical protein